MCVYIYLYIIHARIYIRGAYDKFPDTFIDSTHMKHFY